MKSIKLNEISSNEGIEKLSMVDQLNLIGAGTLCCCGEGSTGAWRKANKKAAAAKIE